MAYKAEADSCTKMSPKAEADRCARMARYLSDQVEKWAQDAVKLTQAENALANAHGICSAAMDSTRCIASGIASLGDNFTDVLVEGLSHYLDFSDITLGMVNTDNKVQSLQDNIIKVMKEIDKKQEEIGRKIEDLNNKIAAYRGNEIYYRSLI